jgi:hypothetical protein
MPLGKRRDGNGSIEGNANQPRYRYSPIHTNAAGVPSRTSSGSGTIKPTKVVGEISHEAVQGFQIRYLGDNQPIIFLAYWLMLQDVLVQREHDPFG